MADSPTNIDKERPPPRAVQNHFNWAFDYSVKGRHLRFTNRLHHYNAGIVVAPLFGESQLRGRFHKCR